MTITTTNYNTAKDKKDEVVGRTYGEGSGVGSKSNIERLAEDYVNSNYEKFTQGSDYESLAKRYSDQGRKAMQDTLGQVAARTGGMASSYATAAGQQAYGDWMGKLEDAARSLYDSQMTEKANKLGVAQGMYDRGYGEWKDQRDFDYDAAQDDITHAKYEDSVIDANNEQALTDYSNDVYADLYLMGDEELANMDFESYVAKYGGNPEGFDERDFEMLRQQVISGRTATVTDVEFDPDAWEPTMTKDETIEALESGDLSVNLLKNYEHFFGESYMEKQFKAQDWDYIKKLLSKTDEKGNKVYSLEDMHAIYGPAIDAWLAYDEAGCQDYIKSLPADHPIVEYLYYINGAK